MSSGRVGIVNVETPEGLDARLKVQLPGQDLTGVEAALEIRDPNNPDAVVYSCRQTDSTITVQGDSIFVVIPPATVGYELTTGHRYEHGLTIRLADGTEIRLQGDWTVLRPVGRLAGRKAGVKPIKVTLADASVVVDLTVGPQGPQGGSGNGSGYAELEFSGADLAAGQLLLFTVPLGKYILDIDLDITTSFGCNFSVGTLDNPFAYAELIPADRHYTAPIRKVSQGQAIYLTTDDPSVVGGMCKAVITCFGQITAAGGYAELEFSGADLAAGQLLLFIPPPGRYILDVDLDITTSFGCNFSVGTLDNPFAYAELIPADRHYTAPIRKVSQGQAIYLTTDDPSVVGGIGRAVITLM